MLFCLLAFRWPVSAFKRLTGCPVPVNTSFNVRGEPIVCSAEHDYRRFMGWGIEVLVVGTGWLAKSDQPTSLAPQERRRFDPD